MPNLEILTDDVRCSHASAVGPVDEEQLYYLESRGIPPVAAERLIVLGFLGEVLDRLPARRWWPACGPPSPAASLATSAPATTDAGSGR